MAEAQAAPTRCGYVALIGAPNAGKSTLLNRLVGRKLAIVTLQPQTTRTRLLGIAIEGRSQIVYVDTPGIFAPRRRLDRAMVAAAWSGAEDADQAVLLVDAARGIDRDTRRILDRLAERGRASILALNKIDLVRRESPARPRRSARKEGPLRPDLHDLGLQRRRGRGSETTPCFQCSAGPMAIPRGPAVRRARTADRRRDHAREQIFLQLRDELPYGSTVETEQWEDRNDGSARIEQVIFVQRPSQRAIVLGEGGQRIKIDRRPRPRRARADARPAGASCFCSSKCARTGSRTASAIQHSGSTTTSDAVAGHRFLCWRLAVMARTP
mgnify:CR=1 FL=1